MPGPGLPPRRHPHRQHPHRSQARQQVTEHPKPWWHVPFGRAHATRAFPFPGKGEAPHVPFPRTMTVQLGIPVLRAAGDKAGAGTPSIRTPPGARGPFWPPGNRLRLSVTDKCNLRCTYCMPADGLQWLPKQAVMTAGEIQRIVGIRVSSALACGNFASQAESLWSGRTSWILSPRCGNATPGFPSP